MVDWDAAVKMRQALKLTKDEEAALLSVQAGDNFANDAATLYTENESHRTEN